MTRERAKELVMNKIKRSEKIGMTVLTNSFHGRISKIRELVDALVLEKKVMTENQKNEHGPSTLMIMDSSIE